MKGKIANPRTVALLGLEALARYKGNIARPGEHMHERMATRLARVAADNRWELAVEEYRSPFLLPPAICTNERYARMAPFTHVIQDACPVHRDDKTYNAPVPKRPDIRWREWGECREEYATAPPGEEGEYIRQKAMTRLLNCVTEEFPPDAPMSRENTRISGKIPARRVLGILYLAFLGAVIGCDFAGAVDIALALVVPLCALSVVLCTMTMKAKEKK